MTTYINLRLFFDFELHSVRHQPFSASETYPSLIYLFFVISLMAEIHYPTNFATFNPRVMCMLCETF